MKFCIPVKGARIVLNHDLTVDIDTYYGKDFIKYKDCPKEEHTSTFYNGCTYVTDPKNTWRQDRVESPRGAEYKWYSIKNDSKITIPKDSILKIENLDMSWQGSNQPYRVIIKFSLAETSLELEPFQVLRTADEYENPKERNKHNKNLPAKFFLDSSEFNELDFEFAV